MSQLVHETLNVYRESIHFVTWISELLETILKNLSVHNQLDEIVSMLYRTYFKLDFRLVSHTLTRTAAPFVDKTFEGIEFHVLPFFQHVNGIIGTDNIGFIELLGAFFKVRFRIDIVD